MKSFPDATIQFMVATFPDALEAMSKEFVHKTLLNAVAKTHSDLGVRVLLATYPDAVKATAEVITDWMDMRCEAMYKQTLCAHMYMQLID